VKYYICANTSLGYWDFTRDNTYDVQTTVSINCINPYVTDWVLSTFCEELNENYDAIVSPGSDILKSGIILKSRRKAFVSNCEEALECINLDKYFDLNLPSDKAVQKRKEMEACYSKAKLVHDEWEKIYISNMDFPKLDSFCNGMLGLLVNGESKEGTGKVYKRFFGTTTPEGAVNFIDDITASLGKRYFIKGRPGTGKSTFLKKLCRHLTERGYDVEEYHCSFDPKSLDMVVSRELSFCVFDSTAPHEKFPTRQSDEILDFYRESGLYGIDEKYKKELAETKKSYDAFVKSGAKALKEAITIENKEYLKQFQKVKNTADIKLLF